MAEFKAPDGGYLFNAEQFHVTKDALGRPVVNAVGGAVGVPVVVNGKPGPVITLTCDDIPGGTQAVPMTPEDKNQIKANEDMCQILDAEVGDIKKELGAIKTTLTSKQNTLTGATSMITEDNLEANKVVVTDEAGKIVASNVDKDKLGYLDNLNSNVQEQLDNKLSANENIDLAEHAITNAQKISTNGVAPVYIGSVIEPSGTEGVKMTGVTGGGVAFVKPDSQNDYVPVYGGTPTDSNHLTNKQYVDKAIIDKFKAYLESEEGKAWIKALLGITGG